METESGTVENFRAERISDALRATRTLNENERYNKLLTVVREVADNGNWYGTAHVLRLEQSLSEFLGLVSAAPFRSSSPSVVKMWWLGLGCRDDGRARRQ